VKKNNTLSIKMKPVFIDVKFNYKNLELIHKYAFAVSDLSGLPNLTGLWETGFLLTDKFLGELKPEEHTHAGFSKTPA
jgi:hypothetical protein